MKPLFHRRMYYKHDIQSQLVTWCCSGLVSLHPVRYGQIPVRYQSDTAKSTVTVAASLAVFLHYSLPNCRIGLLSDSQSVIFSYRVTIRQSECHIFMKCYYQTVRLSHFHRVLPSHCQTVTLHTIQAAGLTINCGRGGRLIC